MSSTATALAPNPLSSYLAAVGLLRVLAEQLDPVLAGHWASDRFIVDDVDDDDLVRFLVDEFRPSPVFSPWNKEGDPTQNHTTAAQLSRLTDSGSPRFASYRSTIQAWQALSDTPAWTSGDKAERLLAWRASAPDDALGWIDATAVAGPDGASFPPLLGSGGNDGRFEFARLLHGELIRLMLDERQIKHSEGWLRSLLFAIPGPALVDSTSGMYDGDAAGGPNSSPQGSAKSASNPWTIVLAFEGLIAFGSAVASRLGAGRHQLVGAPFTIRASRLDDASSPDEESRGEFLAPLWTRPTRWPELRRVIGEGRLSWQGTQAVNTIDAARSVASLGADRGIDSFVRHQIAQRNGLSYVAAPAGRMTTGSVVGVGRLGSLDGWIRNVRSVQTASVRASLRRHERAQAAAVDSGGRPEAFQEVLITLADLERAVGSSVDGRDKSTPFPLARRGEPTLSSEVWLPLLDDGSAEIRLAASIASLRSFDTDSTEPGAPFPSAALALRGMAGTRRWMQWAQDSDIRDPRAVDAWQAKDRAILELLRARLLRSRETPALVTPEHEQDGRNFSGGEVGYPFGLWAPLGDVMSLLDGDLDVERITALCRGLSMLDGWDGRTVLSHRSPHQAPQSLDPWYAAVRLCLDSRPLTVHLDSGERKQILLPARRRWARALLDGSLDTVGRDAAGILRRCHVTHLRRPAPPGLTDRRAIAIALLVRLSPTDIAELARALGAPIAPTSAHGKEQS